MGEEEQKTSKGHESGTGRASGCSSWANVISRSLLKDCLDSQEGQEGGEQDSDMLEDHSSPKAGSSHEAGRHQRKWDACCSPTARLSQSRERSSVALSGSCRSLIKVPQTTSSGNR